MNMIGGMLGGGGDKILSDVDEKKQGMGFDLSAVMQGTQGPMGGAPMRPPGQTEDPATQKPVLNDFLKFLNR